MSEIESLPPALPLELEGKTLVELNALRSALIGDRNSFDELSEEEIERYISILSAMRMTGRVASKPAANGGTKRKAKTPDKDLDDLLGSI